MMCQHKQHRDGFNLISLEFTDILYCMSNIYFGAEPYLLFYSNKESENNNFALSLIGKCLQALGSVSPNRHSLICLCSEPSVAVKVEVSKL